VADRVDPQNAPFGTPDLVIVWLRSFDFYVVFYPLDGREKNIIFFLDLLTWAW
jgi:hypothetical protein